MENHYRLILQRIDNFINSINTKGALIVAFNTLICGNIVAKYSDFKYLIEHNQYPWIIQICLILIILVSLVSVFFVGLAVFPFLKSGNSSSEKYHSHIFFNSISEFKTVEKFLKSCDSYTVESSLEDLKRQIYILSKGLKKKFKYIGWSMILFVLNLIIFFVLILIFIFGNGSI